MQMVRHDDKRIQSCLLKMFGDFQPTAFGYRPDCRKGHSVFPNHAKTAFPVFCADRDEIQSVSVIPSYETGGIYPVFLVE
jgi:hypothetical protein